MEDWKGRLERKVGKEGWKESLEVRVGREGWKGSSELRLDAASAISATGIPYLGTHSVHTARA